MNEIIQLLESWVQDDKIHLPLNLADQQALQKKMKKENKNSENKNISEEYNTNV